MATKRIKHRYLQGLGITIMVLALVRCMAPGVATQRHVAANDSDTDTLAAPEATAPAAPKSPAAVSATPAPERPGSRYRAEGQPPHPIRSVHSYAEAFPDSNHVQLEAARRWGVPPVKNRDDAEQRKSELVFVGASPYYDVAHLDASIAYLVPRAAVLLQDIGVSFMDSLQAKGLPLYHVKVTSVLRTEADVKSLRRSNHNATEQSCHLWGTTFDINYTSFVAQGSRTVGDDKLKWVLSEVLNDMRQAGRCYVKYEQRQPCFHITVR